MKVCLIISPSVFLLDERVFPSLGLLRVAASLEAYGVEVDVLDLSGVSNYLDVVDSYVASQTGEVMYGITATTPQMPATHKITQRIRQLTKDRVVLGGPHATLVNAAAKRDTKFGRDGRGKRALGQLVSQFDCVVAGDGEDAAIVALDGADRLIDADDPKSGLFMTDKRYELTPLPARHLIDLSSYHYSIDGQRATSLIAQLGCPFECAFCGGRYSSMLRRIRTRSTESIVAEMEQIHRDYGYTGFMFYDDELNVNKGLVGLMDAICDLQERLGTQFKLRGFVKSELLNDEQAAALYRAGFRILLVGFESGSSRILTNINKKATLDENTRCMEILDRHGLKVKALMSVGHAGESEETIDETRDWLLRVGPDDFDLTVITTYPGTPYYDDADETAPGVWTFTSKKTGDRLHSLELDYNVIADYYKGDPDGGYKAYVYTDHITSDRLVSIRDEVERDVRQKLGIPFNPGAPSIAYDHSMGMSIPPNILRSSR